MLEAAPRAEKKNRCVVARSNPAPAAARLACEPAVSAAQPDFAVLGGQRRARPLRRRPRAADRTGDAAMGRRIPVDPAVRLAAPEARVAGDPREPADADPARRHRHRRLQHHCLYRPSVHLGAERAADPVGGAAVRRVLVAGAVPHASDHRPGARHRHLARRRSDHHRARRSRGAEQRRLQQGRPDLRRRADDLLHLLGD